MARPAPRPDGTQDRSAGRADWIRRHTRGIGTACLARTFVAVVDPFTGGPLNGPVARHDQNWNKPLM
jgi:hypothetical protein